MKVYGGELVFLLVLLHQPSVVVRAAQQVNGITFEDIQPYYNGITDRVFYMELDKYHNNHLLYNDGCALRTLNMASNTSSLVAGSSLQCRHYVESVGSRARFSLITSFQQLNDTHLILTDYNHHCIRLINRNTNATSTYAGKCVTEGHVDGSLLDARFSNPDEIADSGQKGLLYICDGTYIRTLSDVAVNTFVSLGDDTPISLVLGKSGQYLYASTSTRLLQINLVSRSPIYLSGSTQSGFRDGPLHLARFNSFLNFIFVNEQTILGIDSQNNRLRILDLLNSTVTSICTGGNVTVAGDTETCQIDRPFSAIFLKEQSVILIGGSNEILKLSVSGQPEFPKLKVTTTASTKSTERPISGKSTASFLPAITVPIVVVAILALVVGLIVILYKKNMCCTKCYGAKPQAGDTQGSQAISGPVVPRTKLPLPRTPTRIPSVGNEYSSVYTDHHDDVYHYADLKAVDESEEGYAGTALANDYADRKTAADGYVTDASLAYISLKR